MLLKQLFRALSPPGTAARLSVLIFHRVLPTPDPLFPNEMYAARFDAMCGWLAAWFNVLPLDEAMMRLKSGSLPERVACITFDDGYADNYRVALPILQRYGLTATFFISTGFLDGGRMWNDTVIESIRSCHLPSLDLSSLNLGIHHLASSSDRTTAVASLLPQIKYLPTKDRITITEHLAYFAKAQLPLDLMMTSHEVKAMRQAGMQIGAHTVTHPILARLTEQQAREEILGSRSFLEKLIGERISLFAYPNGKPGEDYTEQTVEVVRSLGFDAAVSTHWGATGMGDDSLQIRRFTPWDWGRLRFGMRLLNNLRNARSARSAEFAPSR
jgi:peptidoglycan/xylan/chitin deacetylase (PgdA/CDA1 family)